MFDNVNVIDNIAREKVCKCKYSAKIKCFNAVGTFQSIASPRARHRYIKFTRQLTC